MKWVVGSLLILLLALAFDLGLLAYSMYALLGIMAVSHVLSRSWAESLVASRRCNTLKANVGDRVAVVVDIENQGRLPIVWALLEDVLPHRALLFKPPALGVTGKRQLLATLKAGGTHSIYYQVDANRRGYYQIGPVIAETGDLFGLHRKFRVLAEPHFLMVMPKVVALDGYQIASRRPIGEVRMVHRLFEDPTRISGVRAYQPGDPMRRIHWHATARTGSLHSKVYEASSVAGATILLDFHESSYDRKHEPKRSDLAVTAAASIASALYQLGQQVGLVTNARDAADRIRREGWAHDLRTRAESRQAASMLEDNSRLEPVIVPTRRGVTSLTQIMETLARAELTDGLTLSQLVMESTSRLPRDASVVVILAAVTEEMAISLGMLHRTGFAVTAILNIYDTYDYSQAAGMLLAQSVESRQLKDEAQLRELCRSYAIRQ